MNDDYPELQLNISSGFERAFPTLNQVQVDRIMGHGRLRQVQTGEILVEAGDKTPLFFIVKTGLVEIAQPLGDVEKIVALFRPGQFTGEISVLFGRRILVRMRAREGGEVIELDRENLLALVQTDSELSDIFMRAFILRRVELIAAKLGDHRCYSNFCCCHKSSLDFELSQERSPLLPEIRVH